MSKSSINITSALGALDYEDKETVGQISQLLQNFGIGTKTYQINTELVSESISELIKTDRTKETEIYNYLQHVIDKQQKKKMKLSIHIDYANEEIKTQSKFNEMDKKTQALHIKQIFSGLGTNEKRRFYTMLRKLSVPATGITMQDAYNIDIFRSLGKMTKKKVAYYYFCESLHNRYPELKFKSAHEKKGFIKKKFQEILKSIIEIRDEYEELIDVMRNKGMDPVIVMIGIAFIDNQVTDGDGRVLSQLSDMDTYESNIIEKLFNTFPNEKQGKFNSLIFDQDPEYIEEKERTMHTKSLYSKLIQENITGTKTNLPYHPFINDVSGNQIIQGLGSVKEYKKIFTSFYLPVFKKLNQKFKGMNFDKFDIYTKKANEIDESSPKQDIYSILFQRDTNGKGYDIKTTLSKIGSIAKSLISDLRSTSTTYYPYQGRGFHKPISGRCELQGFFRENLTHDGANITHYRSIENHDQGVFQLSVLSELSQTELIYLLLQISVYLKHQRFIKPQEIYSLIYQEYNKELNQEHIHDISIFEDQYQNIIENIIRPLSIEAQKEGITAKPVHTALVGVPGGGKTQFLYNLQKRSTFEFNEKKLHLNANVIVLDLQEFVKAIVDSPSFLSNIRKKTGRHTILIIEDMDSVLKENEQGSNVITQKITTFLNETGSNGITIITTTNYHRNFPPRLIRPDRINNIVVFNLPLQKNIVEKIIDSHSKKLKLTKKERDIIKTYIPKMEYFSASYIASFVKSVKDKKDFNKKFGIKKHIAEKDIEQLFDQQVIPIEDMQKRKKDLDVWYKEITNQEVKSIGF